MNFMDVERMQVVDLQGEGFFLGRTQKMDFDILVPIDGDNVGEKILDELQRDLHTEFMAEAASVQVEVDCEELESSSRLLITDLIEEFELQRDLHTEFMAEAASVP